MACATAAEIHRLLTLAREGKAMLGSEPVRAGDIAVLVRTGAEGKLVQQELARCLPSPPSICRTARACWPRWRRGRSC